MHPFFLERRDLAAVSSIDDIDLRIAVDVAHEAYAARAQNAALPIEHQRGPEIDVAPDAVAVEDPAGEFHAALIGPERVREVLQRTLSALVAHRAVERVIDEQEFEHARTRFDVRFAETPLPESAWSAAGIDAAEFFVSPNPGEELRPLARIVSGGELSRIMLAVKTLSATRRHGFSDGVGRPPGSAAPGLIFDEVDAGIGGRVADVVGRKLRALGSAFQVLCITHLPQIAACADTHFQIDKRVEGGRTRTTVKRLDAAGRIGEIARMLGGAPTEALLATAGEMLAERSAGAKGEAKAKGESERPEAKPLAPAMTAPKFASALLPPNQ